jgi:hypothetical protein
MTKWLFTNIKSGKMIGTAKMNPLLFTFFNWNQNQNWAANMKTIIFAVLLTRGKS